MKATCESENGSPLGSIHDAGLFNFIWFLIVCYLLFFVRGLMKTKMRVFFNIGTLAGISQEGVNKLPRHANRRGSSRKKGTE